MRHINAGFGVTAALAALASFLFLLAPGAQAKRALVELRVEGAGKTLDPGTWYVTGNERVQRGRGDGCVRRKGKFRFSGPSALTLLGSAQKANRKLAPIRVRNTDFGPQVCKIGSLQSFGSFPGDSGGLLYWQNFVSGFSSPDVAMVKNRDRVLWLYAEFGSSPVNTDKALELKGVPARSSGEFTARVVVHDFDGTPSPVPDATIRGAQSAVHLGNGRYEIKVGRGRTTLSAERGLDVRSNHVTTCSKPKLSKCPRAHGRTIVGSSGADKIRGTKGWDVIKGGPGRDRIDLRKGGRDRVNCGGGKDVVLLRRGDRDDRIARNCERIRRS